MHQQIITILSVIIFALSLTLVGLSMKSKKEGFDNYGAGAYYRDSNNNPEYVSEYSSLEGTGGADVNTYVGFGQNN